MVKPLYQLCFVSLSHGCGVKCPMAILCVMLSIIKNNSIKCTLIYIDGPTTSMYGGIIHVVLFNEDG